MFLARIYKGLKKYLINYYLYIMYVLGEGHYVSFVFCGFVYCQRRAGASSVEVFFVDAELVTNKLYRSRWEEFSCGCDAEGGDLLSVCEHPSTEEFGTDACGACDLVFALCFHSRRGFNAAKIRLFF